MPGLSVSVVESSHLVQPNDTNAMDVAHGGNVVKWMDEVGGMSAMRFSNEICVTAGMNQVDFHHPIQLGNAGNIQAYVFRTGDTSLDVFIRVTAEDMLDGSDTVTTESCFTYVAINVEKDPISVPDVEVKTEREQRLLDRALERCGGDSCDA